MGGTVLNFTGFSCNTEHCFDLKNKLANSGLGGGGVNLFHWLTCLGFDFNALLSVGNMPNDNVRKEIEGVLGEFGDKIILLPYQSDTNRATITLGLDGQVSLAGHSFFGDANNVVDLLDGLPKIGHVFLQGVKQDQLGLVSILFNKANGLRSLNLNHKTWALGPDWWLYLLQMTDVLFCNDIEWIASGLSVDEVFACGVSVVVITHNGSGASIYTCNGDKAHSDAMSPVPFLCEVGAGDSFTAAVLAYLLRHGIESVKNSKSCLEVMLACAVRFAGAKVGFLGSQNISDVYIQELKSKL